MERCLGKKVDGHSSYIYSLCVVLKILSILLLPLSQVVKTNVRTSVIVERLQQGCLVSLTCPIHSSLLNPFLFSTMSCNLFGQRGKMKQFYTFKKGYKPITLYREKWGGNPRDWLLNLPCTFSSLVTFYKYSTLLMEILTKNKPCFFFLIGFCIIKR